MRSRPDWVSDALYPFTDRWLAVDGADLHYVDEGEGPTVLLAHGNPTWSFLYRDVIRDVAGRARCVALDLPGFGLSSAPAGFGFTPAEQARVLERFVVELDLRDVTLVVQDWGGPTGMWVAGRQPDRFARFVVGNTWAWPYPGLGPRVWSFTLGGPPSALLVRRLNGFVEIGMRAGTRTSLPSEVLDHYRRPFPTSAARRPIQVLAAAVHGAAPWLQEVDDGLAAVRDRPVTLTWPDSDPIFPEAVRKGWEDRFADHDVVTLRGAKHFIQEDAPLEIGRAIRASLS